MKPAREPASSRPKPCASLKKPQESCPFAAPCGPRRKKNDRGQRSAFPSETSRFKPVILAHRGSALPWLVNDRAALRLRRIWCVVCIYLVYYPTSKVITSMYVCRCTCVACGTLSTFHYNMYGTRSIFYYSIMWLSRWRYGEALQGNFLYTTKLESKFLLRPTGIPPRIGKGLYLA